MAGATQQFATAGRTFIAKVPKPPAGAHFPKEDFHLDMKAGICTCPAGLVTAPIRIRLGTCQPRRYFRFLAAVGDGCALGT